jgi:hypothetical protein
VPSPAAGNHRADELGAGLDGLRVEQHRDGQVDREQLADAGEQPHGDEAVPAEVEEVVVHADVADAEQLLPQIGERLLDVVAGRHERGIELRPGEHHRAVGTWRPRGERTHRLHLPLQPAEVERADDELRPRVRGERPLECRCAFTGSDALFDVVAEQQLRTRDLPCLPAVNPTPRRRADRGRAGRRGASS